MRKRSVGCEAALAGRRADSRGVILCQSIAAPSASGCPRHDFQNYGRWTQVEAPGGGLAVDRQFLTLGGRGQSASCRAVRAFTDQIGSYPRLEELAHWAERETEAAADRRPPAVARFARRPCAGGP